MECEHYTREMIGSFRNYIIIQFQLPAAVRYRIDNGKGGNQFDNYGYRAQYREKFFKPFLTQKHRKALFFFCFEVEGLHVHNDDRFRPS